MSTSKAYSIETMIDIPSDVKITLHDKILEVKGPKGSVRKDLSKIPVDVSIDGNTLTIRPYIIKRVKKQHKAIVNTMQSIVKNMIEGVQHGYTYKLKIVFAHFPITVKVKDKQVLIENFVGERAPRVARIVGDCKVAVEGEDVIVKGISLEDVSQTAANIENATRIKGKDLRVFLDGIYIYAKEKGM